MIKNNLILLNTRIEYLKIFMILKINVNFNIFIIISKTKIVTPVELLYSFSVFVFGQMRLFNKKCPKAKPQYSESPSLHNQKGPAHVGFEGFLYPSFLGQES